MGKLPAIRLDEYYRWITRPDNCKYALPINGHKSVLVAHKHLSINY